MVMSIMLSNCRARTDTLAYHRFDERAMMMLGYEAAAFGRARLVIDPGPYRDARVFLGRLKWLRDECAARSLIARTECLQDGGSLRFNNLPWEQQLGLIEHNPGGELFVFDASSMAD